MNFLIAEQAWFVDPTEHLIIPFRFGQFYGLSDEAIREWIDSKPFSDEKLCLAYLHAGDGCVEFRFHIDMPEKIDAGNADAAIRDIIDFAHNFLALLHREAAKMSAKWDTRPRSVN
ncbi:hypothetical protein PLUTO_00280 [Luteibacter phage vB_LflM-Pluto]|uniref:Uncharacterized protein n=1 Tax=Luteibacter phage vB_LflM-Pluto TaxID=2948611 RepID=A0A9E7SM79_9CAUD|nr:hypothetical protein PLUTO_00280 [Luteibacter phage vB_LflM-Pluto]